MEAAETQDRGLALGAWGAPLWMAVLDASGNLVRQWNVTSAQTVTHGYASPTRAGGWLVATMLRAKTGRRGVG